MRAQTKRSPPNAKINACNKKQFFFFEKSSKTGFAHYYEWPPSSWNLTSPEIDLLRGNSHMWKLTFSVVEVSCWNRLKIEVLHGNRPSSWTNGDGWFPWRRWISWNKPVHFCIILFVASGVDIYEQKFYFVLCSWRAAVTWPYRITSFCSVLTTSSSQELYGLSLQVTKPAHISIWKFACHITTWPT